MPEFTIPNGDPIAERKGGGNWIQGAIKHPGALHADLGIPQGKKIPLGMIQDASHAKGTLGRRARLALTLRGITMRHSRRLKKERAGKG
jgi:hypothetical protein